MNISTQIYSKSPRVLRLRLIILFFARWHTAGHLSPDVYINDKYVSSDSLTFQEISHDAGATASPCLSAEYLNSWLINTTAYPQLFEAGETCARLSAIPGMTFSVSLAQQRIDFTVPQAAMLNRPRDYIPESQWQQDQCRSSQL